MRRRLISAARLTWVFAFFAVSCATAPQAPQKMPERPPERSSVDVLLRHRGELQLSDEQVRALEELDSKRESDVAQLPLPEHRKQESGSRPAASAPQTLPDNAKPPGMGRGGGFGGGPMPRSPGMGMGGMGRDRSSMRAPIDDSAWEERLKKLDDIDTRYFLMAMPLLNDEQKPVAEKLATAFRSALYDFREAMRRRREHVE